MRVVRILSASLLGFLLFDVLIFHSRLYLSVVSPDSSTGYLETFLRNEKLRIGRGGDQVLAVGDSRMMFFTRYANELTPETGYTFATISTAGTTPRCWYYMLRDIDPAADRYGAVVVPVDDYDDGEIAEDLSNRLLDLHYLIGVLRLSDLDEFAGSMHSVQNRVESARGILLNGLVYKADFQDLLLHPIARVQSAALNRRDSASWMYSYIGPSRTMEGVSIDWAARTLTVPADVTPAQKAEFTYRFLAPRPADMGHQSAYLKYWLGKISDRYRGSKTRVIIIRIPRGPFIRPDQPPVNPQSSVRELASRSNVIVNPEHFFDELERPRFFMDQMHLNWAGSLEFTRTLARQVRQLLGPPPANGSH